METLLLSQMRENASIVACKARADWFQYQYAITCPKSVPVGQETPTRSPERSLERSPERSPDHSPERNPERSPEQSPECSSDQKQQSNLPTVTSPLFGVPPDLAGNAAVHAQSNKEEAPLYGKLKTVPSPDSVTTSPGSVKSATETSEARNSPLFSVPSPLSQGLRDRS